MALRRHVEEPGARAACNRQEPGRLDARCRSTLRARERQGGVARLVGRVAVRPQYGGRAHWRMRRRSASVLPWWHDLEYGRRNGVKGASSMKRIVVVGGGFAGFWSAAGAMRKLDQAGMGPGDVEVTLVEKNDFHSIRVRNYEEDLDSFIIPLSSILAPIDVKQV